MDQINIDQIVEKFKDRLVATKEAESFRKEVVEPLSEAIFKETFVKIFDNIAKSINSKVGTEVIKTLPENKNKYIIEGLYHRIIFQRSSPEILGNSAYINIIPIYTWKGVQKHLGPISLIINIETKDHKWDITYDSVESYAKKIFEGFTEDKDFNI